jgi:2-C-methyl-D-erythritol 4-phosphate cytidylyltransferase
MVDGKKIGVVIPAAGEGKRMKSSQRKQFLMVADKPILLRTMEIFNSTPEVDSIVLVTAADKINYVNDITQRNQLSKVHSIIEGGTERQDSVWNGLKKLSALNIDYVIIHDAVRPFITQKLIRSVLLGAIEYGAAIAAVKPSDTVKYSEGKNFIKGTYDRNRIWLAQTPQAFKFSIIYDAYEKALTENFYSTDDASLVERYDGIIKLVEGESWNIKITNPFDLELGEIIAKSGVLNNT